MLTLHLIRHGDPDYATDSLTERGRAEAEALAQRMLLLRPEALYTSPLGRARQTAAATEALLGRHAQLLPWTAEVTHLGELTNGDGMVWDVAGSVVRTGGDPRFWGELDRLPVNSAAQLVQGLSELQDEADGFLARYGLVRDGGLYRISGSWRPRSVALFCHAGFATTWLAQLLGLPAPVAWSGLFLPTSSVTTVLFERREATVAAPRALAIGDTSHLYAASMPFNPLGLHGMDLSPSAVLMDSRRSAR